MSLVDFSYHAPVKANMFDTIHEQLNVEYSVSLKRSHLMFLLLFVGLLSAYAIRYRVSRTYSRLPKELDNNEDDDQSIAADMWNEALEPDSDSDSNSNEKPVSSHFDEFLKAIKVFGYLDHDVFTELTKSTHTLKVHTGEIVKLKDLGGFAVVISGAMKVYCRSSDCAGSHDDDFTEGSTQEQQDPFRNYDLLNEITVSAPISSLSSILSLFSGSIESDAPPTEFDKVNDTVLAVASEPSTIVVIPAEAFKDLTHKFPQAAANIVQVILFRWSQITVRTCQRYLNLTQEFYGTERMLNDSAQKRIEKRLPRKLRESVVRKMKKMSKESSENVFELRTYRNTSRNPMVNSRIRSPRERSRTFGEKSTYISSPPLHEVQSDINIDYPETYLSNPTAETGSETSSSNNNDTNDDSSASSGPFRDPEEFALRRAIVETMFSTMMVDSPFALPEEFVGRPVDSSRTELLSSPTFEGEYSTCSPTEDSKVLDPSKRIQRNDSFMVKGHRATKTPLFTIDPSKRINDKKRYDLNEASVEDDEDTTNKPQFSHPSYQDVINEASEVVELYWYKKGQYISKYGEKCCGLIYVLDGKLEVGYRSTQSDPLTYEKLYDVEPGQIIGFLETISSYSSFVDLVAKEDTCIAVISKNYFERLAEAYPLLYITAAKALTTSLTRPIVQLDFALEWISIKSGGKLISEGQDANAIYFVLNGRMRVYNKRETVGDYGQGSTLGELETMSGEKYDGSVIAVRDTELSRFPKSLVECLARQHPSVTFEMSRMVVQAMRLRNMQNNEEPKISDFKTLAILRTSPGLPLEDFAVKLSGAFADLGKVVKILTHSVIMQHLGKYTHLKLGSLRLKAYLADLEEKNDIILYVADSESSSQWSRTCIDQADCVLLLADGSAPPVFSDVEKMVVKSPTLSRAHLILLHNDKVLSHGSTAKWLKHRPWISAHYHVQIPYVSEGSNQAGAAKSRVQRKLNQIKTRVQDELRVLQYKQKEPGDNIITKNYTSSHLEYKNDINRLARVLAGEAVGIVLGGGGARGLSHIGVIQALEESGVPIDLVGGTSIGSFIGGLYAQDNDIVPLMRKSKLFSVRMSSFWRLLLDLTYPMTAWTTGHAFNSAIWKCLGDSRIEDFWVRYFTNTTNLTDSKMEVHEKGYAWRFIRASMSLAGLLPPLEENGKMLLDGGYVDNLPVTEMKKMGARYIIAVDVGAVDDTTPMKYGDTLSGFGALINKFNPFSITPNVPNIAEIQQRLTYVSSVKALEEAKIAQGVIYLRPPIDNYATLDFSKFDEIREVGFEYADAEIKRQIAKGTIPSIKAYKSHPVSTEPYAKYRRYSF